MTTPAFDVNDLGVSQRPGSYEAQLADWATKKVQSGADPMQVRQKVSELVHAYRRSLANQPDTPGPETTGDKVAGAISSAYQGLTLGAGNKITAGVRTVLPEALGGVKGFDFPEALKENTQVLQDFQQRHPLASAGLEVAGSIPTVLATGGAGEAQEGGALARLARMAKQGAAYGAVSGGLSSNSLSEIPGNVEHGAVTGGIAGPVVGTVLGGVSRGATTLARKLLPGSTVAKAAADAVGSGPVTPDEKASALLTGDLTRGGVNPEDAANSLRPQGRVVLEPQPPTSMLEAGSRNVLARARQARNVPGSNAGQTIDAFLSDRAAGTGQRVENALGAATGHTPTDLEEPIEQVIARRTVEANPLYQRAEAYGEIKDPETVNQIKQLLKFPVFQRAWERGNSLGDLQNMLGGAETNTANLPPSGISPQRWAELRSMGLDQFVPGATNKASAAPTVAQINRWKKGLDAVIESGSGSENALSREEAGTYRRALGQVLDRVDQEVPDFEAARANFRGNSEVKEAAEAGKDHFKPSQSADYLQRTLPERFPSDAEQEAYQSNALNSFVQRARQLAANPDLPEAQRGVNIVQRMMGDSESGRKLRMLFPDDDSYNAFVRQMEQESVFPKSNKFLTQQSSTAAQLAESNGMPSSGTMHDLALSPVSRYAKFRLAGRAIDALTGANKKLDPAVADAVARQVTLTGEPLEDALRRMANDSRAQALAKSRVNALLGNTAAANLNVKP